MTLTEFLSKWNGKYVEIGGSPNALNQCTDLANAYITECLNLPAIFWTNAQDFPSKAEDKYDYILNTPTGVPEEGNLVVWKSKDNYGHIGIFLDGNTSKFNSFDQNFPLGSPCHVQSHTYTTPAGLDVIGWLRPKVNTTLKEALDACMADRTKFWGERDLALAKVTELEKKVVDLNRQISEMAQVVENIKNEDADAIENMHKVEKERDALQNILEESAGEVSVATEEIKTLPGVLRNLVASSKTQEMTISDLQGQVEELVSRKKLKDYPLSTLLTEVLMRILRRR